MDNKETSRVGDSDRKSFKQRCAECLAELSGVSAVEIQARLNARKIRLEALTSRNKEEGSDQ